jgi:hypothetical protein
MAAGIREYLESMDNDVFLAKLLKVVLQVV